MSQDGLADGARAAIVHERLVETKADERGGAPIARSRLAVDRHDLLAVETGHAARHGEVIAEGSIAVDLGKVGKEALDVIHRVGPLRMPREFGFAPRWVGRLVHALRLFWIGSLFHHVTFGRRCQRGKSSLGP